MRKFINIVTESDTNQRLKVDGAPSITLFFSISNDLSFDADAFEEDAGKRGYDVTAQCDHMNFIELHLNHGDFALAAVEAKTFQRFIENWQGDQG